MKVLITGVSGQLGHDVQQELVKRKINCLGVGREQFDITNEQQTREYIQRYNPDVVIHCGAYTAVDGAEDDVLTCTAVNITGTQNIALVCKEINAKMMYISTDYVFNGAGDTPFDVSDKPGPLNTYGRTKLGGEEVVKESLEHFFIVRISWVFGINGNNFIKTMLRLGKEKCEIDVVADQIGSPTYTRDLARLLCDMIETDQYGLYHATNEGYCSWAELANRVFEIADLHVKVNPITTEQFKTRAARPKNSKLSKKSLDLQGFTRLPRWEDAVERYINEIKRENQ